MKIRNIFDTFYFHKKEKNAASQRKNLSCLWRECSILM